MKNKNADSEYIAFNSYGGFNKTKDEYHILNTKTPVPWCNVMANENFGTLVSSYGTVYTYYKNSQGYKISNWCNDWITFKPGEVFSGIYDEDYNLHYGFGYTTVLQENNDILKEMKIFVPPEDNVKIQYITYENPTPNKKTETISYKIDPVLGVTSETTSNYIITRIKDNVLQFKNPYNLDFGNFIPFICLLGNTDDLSVEYNEKEYEIKITFDVLESSKRSFAIALGCAEDNDEYIDYIKNKYNTNENIEKELKNTIKYWREKVVKNFNTGDEYIDIMANGFLLYQTIVCRLFAKTGFYQCGGAIGFRDQLQDTLALIRTWPEKTRSQIILHSSHQFEKGDVLHWWHEYNNSGIRTYFSDDYLWLPYVLSEYVSITKDYSILDVMTKYLEDKPMGDKREAYNIYNNIDVSDSVYGHAKKAILYGLSRQNPNNNLLDIGDGDWNDGFSNIRGQSVWLTFFMMDVLKRFIPLAKHKKDKEMEKKCEKMRHILKHAIIEHCWDHDHFVRAFFENGEVLGSYKNKECKIDLISQAWAVIAMKEYKDVEDDLHECLKTADKYLVDDENMIVRLLYPSFDHPENNPGYIRAYVPGIRENGGQYTHGATWLSKAYFELGDKKDGIKILKYINPISHSDTKEKADIYMVEPYVVAADVYTNKEHLGRGGWTWYTGSSAWVYKIIEDYLS